MTYGVIVQVPAPIEAYEATHVEIMKVIGDGLPPGMIFHAARPTDQGFELYEVWDSKEQSDAFNEQVVGPAVARTGADAGGGAPEVTEFEPRGVIGRGLHATAS